VTSAVRSRARRGCYSCSIAIGGSRVRCSWAWFDRCVLLSEYRGVLQLLRLSAWRRGRLPPAVDRPNKRHNTILCVRRRRLTNRRAAAVVAQSSWFIALHGGTHLSSRRTSIYTYTRISTTAANAVVLDVKGLGHRRTLARAIDERDERCDAVGCLLVCYKWLRCLTTSCKQSFSAIPTPSTSSCDLWLNDI